MTSTWENIMPASCEIDAKGYITTIDENTTASSNFYTPLSHLSLVHITGEDAHTFLQNQFSNDINLVTSNVSQLSSYSSPKGMLYSNFRISKTTTGYLLLIPKDIATQVTRRLSMFVLRDDVKIESAESIFALGIVSDNTKSLNSALNAPKEQQINDASDTAYGTIIRCHDNDTSSRHILIGTQEQITTSIDKLNAEGFKIATTSQWLTLQILSGEAFISESTYEQYVGQMINLDLIDAINFKKGCYPGQEYIARTQYRGQVRSRLYILQSEQTTFNVLDTLSIEGKLDSDPIGTVINASGNYALAVIRTKHVQRDEVVLTKSPTDNLSTSLPHYVKTKEASE